MDAETKEKYRDTKQQLLRLVFIWMKQVRGLKKDNYLRR